MKKITTSLFVILFASATCIAQESNKETNKAEPTVLRTQNPNTVEYINTSGNVTTERTENPYLNKENITVTKPEEIITTERKPNPNNPE